MRLFDRHDQNTVDLGSIKFNDSSLSASVRAHRPARSGEEACVLTCACSNTQPPVTKSEESEAPVEAELEEIPLSEGQRGTMHPFLSLAYRAQCHS
jgi:hypothetical protein